MPEETPDQTRTDRVEDAVEGGVEPIMVTLSFEAADPDALLAVLSKYVVLARNEPGSRNIDLVASVTRPGRYLIIQKWDSGESQRAHFDGATMVDMARSCDGLLAAAPSIDLHEGVTMHDLA